MTPKRHRFCRPTTAFLAAISLVAAGSSVQAQQTTPTTTAATAPAPEESFSCELGQASTDRGGLVGSTYSVTATADYGSKQTSAKIRLTAIEKDGSATMTHLLTINTGKYKTVAQLAATLAETFRKYLAVEPANQEIGKIGDINHGGEIRFFAESHETLRYDWLTPGEPARSTQFRRADIEVFLGILAHPKAGH